MTRIGQQARVVPDVAVRGGSEASADVALEGAAVALSGVKNGVRGLYARSTTPVAPWVDVVLAGRYDWPTAFDAK